MHGRRPGERDIAGEEDAALAALLRPGRAQDAGAGTTALRPGVALQPPRAAAAAAAGPRDATPAWLPWAALVGGTAIGVGCILLGLWAAPLLVQAIWPAGDMAAAWIDTVFTLMIFVPMLALTLAAGRLTGIPLRAGARPAAMLGLGVAVGACGVTLAAGYAGFAGVARGAGATSAGALVLAGSLLMLLQSGTEEVLLRGWMQPAMATRWSPWVAVTLTALVFAGLHVLGGARSPVSLVNLTLGGVMFGLLRWKTGGLIAPVAAHFAWNWLEGLVLGLDPNPGVGSFGALIDFDMIGPAIWGGSDEGLNASVAMMLVLVALIVPLALWKPRDG